MNAWRNDLKFRVPNPGGSTRRALPIFYDTDDVVAHGGATKATCIGGIIEQLFF
jgi:hypothetical protein